MIGIERLFDFQENCVDKLLEKSISLEKDGVIIKSPTGSGKTLILLEYIDRYLTERKENDTIFIWFTPGAGELEEQSQKEMEIRLPHRDALSIQDVLMHGFCGGNTVFINWEQVNKDGNAALTDGDRLNLLDFIKLAHKNNLRFFIIVDEEHLYNTPKSQSIIEKFKADYIIRASATAKKNKNYCWYEIPEIEVINEGLITRTLHINEGLHDGKIELENEDYELLNLAIEKRNEIRNEYKKLNLNINPLILIQFPDDSEEKIIKIEEFLESLGYSYNHEISKWLADSKDKINLNGLTDLDGKQIFLLMKQAVATGWNCPRAKILVKLRENMKEDFQIQTIGRLRRMPESKHYENEVLDTCYLYTRDDSFKQHVKQNISSAYEIKDIKLKPECKTFSLEKEFKDEDFSGINTKKACDILKKYFVVNYHLKTPEQNKVLLSADYEMSEELIIYSIKDNVTLTDDLTSDLYKIRTMRKINTHYDASTLRQVTDMLKGTIGVPQKMMDRILKKLFLRSQNSGLLLKLSLQEYYAFIINNRDKLKADFLKATADIGVQENLQLTPRTSVFNIPEDAKLEYGDIDEVKELITNAYYGYTTDCFVKRSQPERLFERYCEGSRNVDWVYKNGDSGQSFFSIVYVTRMLKQRLFYPDYIVKLKNDEIWIIEAKGGEDESGHDRNIDIYAERKFNALKTYATNHNIKFGFVREKPKEDQLRLYLNNTTYSEEMNTDNWHPIEDFF